MIFYPDMISFEKPPQRIFSSSCIDVNSNIRSSLQKDSATGEERIVWRYDITRYTSPQEYTEILEARQAEEILRLQETAAELTLLLAEGGR